MCFTFFLKSVSLSLSPLSLSLSQFYLPQTSTFSLMLFLSVLSLSLSVQLFSCCCRSFMVNAIFILSIVYYEPTGGDCYLHVLNASCSSALSLPCMPLLILYSCHPFRVILHCSTQLILSVSLIHYRDHVSSYTVGTLCMVY